jgi:hypothetical protein
VRQRRAARIVDLPPREAAEGKSRGEKDRGMVAAAWVRGHGEEERRE